MRTLIILLFTVGLLAQNGLACRDICKPLNMPVCGITFLEPYTLHTFTNQCKFDHYNCRNPLGKLHLILSKECPVSPTALPTECAATRCLLQYKPFCAVLVKNIASIRYFDNECEMQKHNCANYNNPYIPATSQNVCFI